MSQMNCVNTALPLPQNSCHHSISILHLSWTIHNHSSADWRKSSTSGLTNSGSMPLRSILLRSTPQPFNSFPDQRFIGVMAKLTSITVSESKKSSTRRKKKGKSFVCFLLFFAEHQNLYVAKLRSILSHAATWGILGLGVEASWIEARPVRAESPSPRGLIEKKQPDDSSKIRFALHQLFPLTDNFQHPQVKKKIHNILQHPSKQLIHRSTNSESAGLMHQVARSAWDIWLWRQLLIQQKAKRSNVALHRQRMCHVIPCHTLFSIMQRHHMPAIVCTCSSFLASLTFTDIASSSMEVLRGRVVRQRSARIVHSRHVLSCIGPAVPQSSWQMRTTDGTRYSKTFRDTAPGHLTHIFCHTVISKLYQFVMLFSSVHSVLHQFPECSNMAICSAAKCAGVAPLPQHKLHETIRNLKQSQRPVSIWTKSALGSWLHGSEREMPAWSNGVMMSDWPPEMVD